MLVCVLFVIVCMCRMDSDPAISSMDLRSKLDTNRRIGSSRLDAVSNFTVINNPTENVIGHFQNVSFFVHTQNVWSPLVQTLLSALLYGVAS